MHFNHVIKSQEQKVLVSHYLLAFMTRGAAALGANCQPGIDTVVWLGQGGFKGVGRRQGCVVVGGTQAG